MRSTTLTLAMLSMALGTTLGAPAASAQDYTVTLANMSFGKVPSGLKVGDVITFVNNYTVPHTVTARDHSFDLRLAPRKSDKLTLSKPGTFPFTCIYHSEMRGTLTVAQ